MKIEKKTIAALIILIVLLGSSFITIIEKNNVKIKLPPNIVDYEFDENTRILLINNYRTLIKFRYNLDCEECLDTLDFLIGLAKENSNQLFLQKILDNNIQNFSLIIESYFGEKEVNTLNQTEILKAICDLVYIELADC
ncbi:MAG: hypothetical protein RMJ17_02255 [Candidatus Aenigmarchaeota archaeon]|nr:hypothetical protein [Candidatus Aenigmarchaeota archaeon]MDW8149395.1 hypothetical protein [Candidatus Aenigmarchaeota archaeon]